MLSMQSGDKYMDHRMFFFQAEDGIRVLVLAVDQRVRNDWAAGILPDARSQGTPEFQNHRNDLRRSNARRQFLLLFQNRAGGIVRFRSCRPAFFPADRLRATTVCAPSSR